VEEEAGLQYKQPFLITRHFPTIDPNGKAVECSVTVTNSKPIEPMGRTKIYNDKEKLDNYNLYVKGYKGSFPADISTFDAEESLSDEIGVRRIMQYALLICRSTGSGNLTVIFESGNDFDVVGPSMSYAFEAILLNYPENYLYSGDSNPMNGFLPEMEMGLEDIVLKSSLNKPTVYKMDYSSKATPDIPEDYPIPLLSEVNFWTEGLPE